MGEKVKDLTDLAAEPIVDNYIGLWMKAKGNVTNVTRSYDIVQVFVDGVHNEPGFILRFRKKEWFNRLKTIDKGEEISAAGQITGVSEQYISLEKCELNGNEQDNR